MIHNQIEIKIPLGNVVVEGTLTLPPEAKGVVLFAHGSGSSRFSPRNQYVAKEFNKATIGTLLFDLLTQEEEETDIVTAEYRFNIPLLAQRLIGATEWLRNDPQTKRFAFGYFGASTGAAAAMIAAALDAEVIELNQEAMDQMTAEKKLTIIPGATHLFEEPGTLEQVAKFSKDWFLRYLR